MELRNLPASASQVLGLQACATTAWGRGALLNIRRVEHQGEGGGMGLREWPSSLSSVDLVLLDVSGWGMAVLSSKAWPLTLALSKVLDNSKGSDSQDSSYLWTPDWKSGA